MSNYSELHKRIIELENQKQSLLRRIDFLETERANFSKLIRDLYATYTMPSLPDKPLELKPFINQKEASAVKTICSVGIESTGYLLHADDGTSYSIRKLATFQEFIDDTDYTRIALSGWGGKVELTTPIKLDIVQSNGFTRIVKVSE